MHQRHSTLPSIRLEEVQFVPEEEPHYLAHPFGSKGPPTIEGLETAHSVKDAEGEAPFLFQG